MSSSLHGLIDGPLDHLLHPFLNSPETTDLCFESRSLSVDQGQGLEIQPGFSVDEEELRNWVLLQISRAGKSFDAKNPFIDLVLPRGDQVNFRHRMHAIFPPLSPGGILVSLRKLPNAGRTHLAWETTPGFDTLRAIVRSGKTLLISGATGSGKTRLMNDLLSSIEHRERILSLEDTPELNPNHPQFFPLLSRAPNADGYGEITLRTLLKQTLRMRPDRIVLGEIRGNEALDLLQALNTGHQGTLATLHANSPREALKRLEVLCLLAAGPSLPLSALRELLAGGIQWIAQVERTPSGRILKELVEVSGREGDTILLRPHRFIS